MARTKQTAPKATNAKLARTKQTAPKATNAKSPRMQLAAKSALATAPKTVSIKKTRTTPKGAVALKEIAFYQSTTSLLMSKAAFERLVREIANNNHVAIRWNKKAIEALQVAAEQYLIEILKTGNDIAIHSKRVTVHKEDIKLAITIKSNLTQIDPNAIQNN